MVGANEEGGLLAEGGENFDDGGQGGGVWLLEGGEKRSEEGAGSEDGGVGGTRDAAEGVERKGCDFSLLAEQKRSEHLHCVET
jgi:hypothetical protein